MTVTPEELKVLQDMTMEELVTELYLFATGKIYTAPSNGFLEAIRDEIINKYDVVFIDSRS